MKRALAIAAAVLLSALKAQAQIVDEYTRVELLAPDTGSARVTSDVTLAAPDMLKFTLPIARDASVTDLSVVDLSTGSSLKARLTPGGIEVDLPRSSAGSESRMRIVYVDTSRSRYRRAGDRVTFTRPLSARRGSVVLPQGYELTRAGRPAQILELPDGRIMASFMDSQGAAIDVQARQLKSKPSLVPGSTPANAPAPPIAEAPPRELPLNQIRVAERAIQDRTIVYFLKEPDTHAFALYHDYTAAREGEHQYVNVVRTGSSVSEPSAKILDTGETLKTRTLTGADIAREKIDIPDRVEPETQVVLIPFPPVKKGSSLRLRISETYTDPARYALVDGQLMWHRSFGRPRNDMVLPAGWYLTTSSMPAVITEDADGRIRLSFWNPRPDSLDVLVRGRRR